ncbi:MAG TPA: hypothetical protein VFZ91_16985 [Allosphingosinicella sp.]
MTDPASLIALSGSALVAVGLASAAGLKGWTDWLELRRLQLAGRRGGLARPAPGPRREVADLRERVRRLEAIANGAEL